MKDKPKLTFKEHLANGWFSVSWLWRNARPVALSQAASALQDSFVPILQAFLAGAVITELANVVLGEGNVARLLFFVVGSSLVSVATYSAYSWLNFFNNKYRDYVLIKLKDGLYKKRLELPLEEYELPETNDKFQRANEGSYDVIYFADQLFTLISTVLAIIGTAVIVFNTVPLIMIVLLPLPFITTSTRLKYFLISRSSWDDSRPHRRRAWGIESLFEHEQGAVEVRLYNIGKRLLSLWRKEATKGIDVTIAHQRNSLRLDLILQLIENGVGVAVDIWLVFRVVAGGIAVGLFEQTRRLVSTYISQIYRVTASLSSIAEVSYKMQDYRQFLEWQSVEQSSNKSALADSPQTIVMEAVGFTYPTGASPALTDINLTINRGDHIALVGENGAGKTTLLKIILGLYQTYEGNMYFDRVSAREWSHDSIQKFTSPLMQDFQNYLFLTVQESVAVSDLGDEIDAKRVRENIKRVGLNDFVEGLPNKYESNLGYVEDDGVKLSGGQLQRLAIARALYKKSDILVLDEPTSAIDAKSEQDIIDTIFELYQRKTVLIVSHRLSTVSRADRIVVMKKGRIVEEGTHKQLFRTGTAYYDLFHKQAMRLKS